MNDVVDFNKPKKDDGKMKDLREKLFSLYVQTDATGVEVCETMNKLQGRINTIHDDLIDQLGEVINILCEIFEKHPELKDERIQFKRLEDGE